MFSESQSSTIRELLTPDSRILIIVHRNPDGDALGSSLGLKHYLKAAYNINATLMVPDSFPAFLNWMPGILDVIVADRDIDVAKALLSNADLIFCLDFNHPGRIGDLAEDLRLSKAAKVMIDHHQDPDSFCQIVFSDTKASSTCELVIRWILADKGEAIISKDMASCLYTGLMTDTGSFRFQATTEETHRYASILLSKGIKHWLIHEAILNQNSLTKLRLWGLALSTKLDLVPGYRVAYISLTEQELKEYNYQEGDLEGLVNYALSIQGVEVAALFSERGGKIRISIRSIGDFPVNELSGKYFEGGGHINAAGGVSYVSIEQTIQKFKEAVQTYPQLRNEN